MGLSCFHQERRGQSRNTLLGICIVLQLVVFPFAMDGVVALRPATITTTSSTTIHPTKELSLPLSSSLSRQHRLNQQEQLLQRGSNRSAPTHHHSRSQRVKDKTEQANEHTASLPTKEDEETAHVSSVPFPEIAISFVLNLGVGVPLDKVTFEKILFSFLEYMILADQQPIDVKVELESQFAYNSSTGRGVCVVTGAWMGRPEEAPSPDMFVDAFEVWGLDELKQQLDVASFAPEYLEAKVNNENIGVGHQERAVGNSIQEQDQDDDDESKSSHYWILRLALVLFCVPFIVLGLSFLHKRYKDRQVHGCARTPSCPTDQPTGSTTVVSIQEAHGAGGVGAKGNTQDDEKVAMGGAPPPPPGAAPANSMMNSSNTSTLAVMTGPSTSVVPKVSSTDDDDSDASASTSSGYSGLFEGPYRDASETSSLYFM